MSESAIEAAIERGLPSCDTPRADVDVSFPSAQLPPMDLDDFSSDEGDR